MFTLLHFQTLLHSLTLLYIWTFILSHFCPFILSLHHHCHCHCQSKRKSMYIDVNAQKLKELPCGSWCKYLSRFFGWAGYQLWRQLWWKLWTKDEVILLLIKKPQRSQLPSDETEIPIEILTFERNQSGASPRLFGNLFPGVYCWRGALQPYEKEGQHEQPWWRRVWAPGKVPQAGKILWRLEDGLWSALHLWRPCHRSCAGRLHSCHQVGHLHRWGWPPPLSGRPVGGKVWDNTW